MLPLSESPPGFFKPMGTPARRAWAGPAQLPAQRPGAPTRLPWQFSRLDPSGSLLLGDHN